YPGEAAITINNLGKGKAVYIGPDLEPANLARVLATLLATSGVKLTTGLPRGVEHTVRKAGNTQWTFLLNHTPSPQIITLAGPQPDALTGAARSGKVTLAPSAVLVVQSA